jgi:hypothetical protein
MYEANSLPRSVKNLLYSLKFSDYSTGRGKPTKRSSGAESSPQATCQSAVFGNLKKLENWNLGILESWNLGALSQKESWNLGILESWNLGILGLNPNGDRIPMEISHPNGAVGGSRSLNPS